MVFKVAGCSFFSLWMVVLKMKIMNYFSCSSRPIFSGNSGFQNIKFFIND